MGARFLFRQVSVSKICSYTNTNGRTIGHTVGQPVEGLRDASHQSLTSHIPTSWSHLFANPVVKQYFINYVTSRFSLLFFTGFVGTLSFSRAAQHGSSFCSWSVTSLYIAQDMFYDEDRNFQFGCLVLKWVFSTTLSCPGTINHSTSIISKQI